MNFSIVIPTWNRSELVDALLESLYKERNRYEKGETEVLIVDSSQGEEQKSIVAILIEKLQEKKQMTVQVSDAE